MSLLLQFVGVGMVLAAIGYGLTWLPLKRDKWMLAGVAVALAIMGYAWVNWHAFLDERRDIAGPAWTSRDMPGELWTYVRDEIPPGSTIAYTGTHLVYPLMEGHRVVYVPMNSHYSAIADLPRLGDRLSGERINPAMQKAMQPVDDVNGWFTRLRASGADYLVIAADVPGAEPLIIDRYPAPRGFLRSVYRDKQGEVYRITWPSPPALPSPGR
jgi:hypothetical protein